MLGFHYYESPTFAAVLYIYYSSSNKAPNPFRLRALVMSARQLIVYNRPTSRSPKYMSTVYPFSQFLQEPKSSHYTSIYTCHGLDDDDH